MSSNRSRSAGTGNPGALRSPLIGSPSPFMRAMRQAARDAEHRSPVRIGIGTRRSRQPPRSHVPAVGREWCRWVDFDTAIRATVLWMPTGDGVRALEEVFGEGCLREPNLQISKSIS
jgi:hypothetical protein